MFLGRFYISCNTLADDWIAEFRQHFIKPHFRPDHDHVLLRFGESLDFRIFKPGVDKQCRDILIHRINDVLQNRGILAA